MPEVVEFVLFSDPGASVTNIGLALYPESGKVCGRGMQTFPKLADYEVDIRRLARGVDDGKEDATIVNVCLPPGKTKRLFSCFHHKKNSQEFQNSYHTIISLYQII